MDTLQAYTPMRGEKSAISIFRLVRWTIIAATVLVFLAGSVYAQSPQQRQQELWQQELERLFFVAATAERRGDFIEAELRYQEYRELAQRHRLPTMEAAALHRLAVIRARNNRFTESANMFRRAIELDPRNAMILNDYAQLYAGRRNFAEAEIILKNALSIDPNNPRVLFNLGVLIATQRGERQMEGLRYLKLAVGDADAYRELARIYRTKGDVGRAEFADQKAQLADARRSEEQQSAARILITSPDGNSESIRPPQHTAHQPQTPPEIVNRVRQELIEWEMREIAEAQRNAMDTIAPPPVVPSGTIVASPREIFPIIPPGSTIPPESTNQFPPQSPPARVATTASPQAPPPVAPPVDPFAMATQQQAAPPVSVRRLESPPVDTAPAQTGVRMLPNRSEPPPVIHLPDQSGVPETSVPVQTIEHRATEQENSATSNENWVLPPIQVVPSTQSGQRQNFPPHALNAMAAAEMPRFLSLPSDQTLPGSDGRVERTTVNPLRQVQADRAGWIDPKADTSLIATLPPHSAVGARRMTRADQSDLSGQLDGASNATNPQPGRIVALRTLATERTGVANTSPSIIRDVDVLQSPSAVLARRETSTAAFVPPDYTTTPHDHTFVATDSHLEPPPVLTVPEATPAATLGLEYTRGFQSDLQFSTPTTPDMLSFAPVNRELSPAMGADANSTENLSMDSSVSSERSFEVAIRLLEPSTPSPDAFSQVQLPHMQQVPRITASDSDYPKVAAAIDATPATPLVSAVAIPFPILDDQPKLAGPFPVANNPPRLAEARPTPSPLSALTPLAVEPADPFPVASNLPRLAEARTAPFSLTVPVGESPATSSLLVQPVQEETSGFASSRRTAQEIRAPNNDGLTGFARSRR